MQKEMQKEMQKATLQKLEKVGTVRAKSWFSALMRI
jgi:hypothetical protein